MLVEKKIKKMGTLLSLFLIFPGMNKNKGFHG